MKKWEKPEMVKLNVNRTAGGGDETQKPDWGIYSPDGKIKYAETFGPSGSTPADAVVLSEQN